MLLIGLLILLLQPAAGVGSPQAIEDVRIPTTVEHPHVEPHLAVDPSDPDHVVVAAIVVLPKEEEGEAGEASLFGPPPVRFDCATYVTFDGGRTWQGGRLGLSACGDPWLSIDRSGRPYLAVVGSGAGSDVVIYTSEDGGRTWREYNRIVEGTYDRPSIAVAPGRAGEAEHGVWVVASKSAGLSAADSLVVGRMQKDSVALAAYQPWETAFNVDNPLILSDTTLVVPFSDSESAWLMTGVADSTVQPTWRRVAQTCKPGFNAAAADTTSGAFAGHLYLACVGRQGTGIQVHRSQDGGEGWRGPARLKVGDTGADRGGVALSVTGGGAVGVSWYDRGDVDEVGCQHSYLAVSADGGRTFGAPRRLGGTPSCPANEANGYAGERWPLGGDYGALAGDGAGGFHTVWADAREGRYQLRYARVAARDLAEPDGP